MVEYNKERIDYIRETTNPYYQMDKTEAMTYAAKMGFSDTFRGIGQIGADFFGIDQASDYLKKKDDKLRAIMEHPEWGTDAMVAFLSTAVVADPASYVPIIGWLSKGKKAKNLWDLTKYGAASGGIIGGLSYVPEDYGGVFVDEDASLLTKRLENAGIAAGGGAVLSAGGGKLVDTIQKMRGKGSIFQAPDEIDVKTVKDANSKLDEVETQVAEEFTLKAGSIIRAPDRNNIGKILFIDDKKGIAHVSFHNKKTGNYKIKRFGLDELRPKNLGDPKKTKVENFDSSAKKTDEVVFILDRESNKQTPYYITTDNKKNITYRIEKVVDPKTKKVIPNSWKVSRIKEEPNPMSDPSGELGSLPPIVSQTQIETFSTLKKAKEFIKNKIQPKRADKNTAVPVKEPTEDDIVKKVADELSNDLNDPQVGYQHSNPVIRFYQEKMGTPLKNIVFNNVGESLSGAFGYTIGYNSLQDPNATKMERFANGLLYAVGGAALTKGAKNLDGRFNNNSLSDTVARGIISDYGLDENYIRRKIDFRLNKNKIAAEFFDIQQKAANDLTPEQNNLLWRLMSGELDQLDNLTPEILALNDEARKLITKYANELVDRGLLNPDVMKKNIDTYLKRTYLKHVKNKKGKAMFSDSSKIRMIGDELKMRGLVEDTTLSAYNKKESVWQKEGWEIIEKLKDGKVRVRRDFTKAERVEMEEIEDAAYAISETGRLFANDIATARFFDDLAGDERYVLDEAAFKKLTLEEQQRFVVMPDVKIKGTSTKKYGQLSGMFVDKYVRDDLISTFKMAEEGENIFKEGGRALDTLMTLWKKTKTSWNLGTHVANSTSNVMLLDFADTEFKYLLKAIREMKDPSSQLHKDAKISGIFDADFVSNELGKYATEMERSMIKLQDNYNASGFLNYAGKTLKGAKRMTADKLERAYQLEDSVFRMAVYMDRLDKGFRPEDAALEARKWFIDYSINAPLITALKKTALPFISYTYRVIPLLAEAAIMRPHKFAKWAAIGYGVDAASTYIAGGEDVKKLERLTLREEQAKNMFGVPFMAPTLIRMPFDSASGDSQYLDVSRWVPGGDIFDQRSGKVGVPLLPQPFQPGGLWYDLGYTLTTKTDPFTGQDIQSINVGDTDAEQLKKVLQHFFSKQAPNIPGIPGTYATEKLKKAMRAETGQQRGEPTEGSPYASKYSPIEAVAYGLGIKLRPQNLEVNKEVKQLEYDQLMRDLDKREYAIRNSYNRQSIDIDERDEQLDKIQEERIRIGAEFEVYLRKLDDLEKELGSKKLRDYQRTQKFSGGKIDEKYPVTDVKDTPSERQNFLTKEPYLKDQMNELGFGEQDV